MITDLVLLAQEKFILKERNLNKKHSELIIQLPILFPARTGYSLGKYDENHFLNIDFYPFPNELMFSDIDWGMIGIVNY